MQNNLLKPTVIRKAHDHVTAAASVAAADAPDEIYNILYKGPTEDQVWQVDGYVIKDEVTRKIHRRLHLICPVCDRSLTIESSKKEIGVDDHGRLFVEPFQCSYEGDFGQQLCTFRAAIEPPKGRNLTCDCPQGIFKIHGVYRPA
jgi:hypothetical protein